MTNGEGDIHSSVPMLDPISDAADSLQASPRVDSTNYDDEEEDVLSPDPISYMLPMVHLPNVPSENAAQCLDRPEPSAGHSTGSVFKKLTFKLFRRQQNQDFVLEMIEIETSEKTKYRITLSESDETYWNIKVNKFSLQENDVLQLVQNTSHPAIQSKYNKLSLAERLVGWTVEERARKSSKITDKYYTHERAKQFRSLYEVALFMLFSCEKKDTKVAKEKYERKQILEAFFLESYSNLVNSVVEDYMEMTSSSTSNENTVEEDIKIDHSAGPSGEGNMEEALHHNKS